MRVLQARRTACPRNYGLARSCFRDEESQEQDRESTDPSRAGRLVLPILTDMLRLAEDTVDGVDIRALQPGTTMVVETHDSSYRFVILFDPSAVLVKGGSMFPDHTVVRLVGASLGSSDFKAGWIVVGLRIEMFLGSACIRSSPVRSVKVDNLLPSIWHAFLPDVMN